MSAPNAQPRGRQIGKTYETASVISLRCGMDIEMVMHMLGGGWHYEERDGQAIWVQGLQYDRMKAPVEQAQHITIVPTPNVYGMGGSVDGAVASRLAYDARPGDDTARTWLAAEDRLSEQQYLQYQQLYGRARMQR